VDDERHAHVHRQPRKAFRAEPCSSHLRALPIFDGGTRGRRAGRELAQPSASTARNVHRSSPVERSRKASREANIRETSVRLLAAVTIE
jgi:hypothetical protein